MQNPGKVGTMPRVFCFYLNLSQNSEFCAFRFPYSVSFIINLQQMNSRRCVTATNHCFNIGLRFGSIIFKVLKYVQPNFHNLDKAQYWCHQILQGKWLDILIRYKYQPNKKTCYVYYLIQPKNIYISIKMQILIFPRINYFTVLSQNIMGRGGGHYAVHHVYSCLFKSITRTCCRILG